MKIRTRLLLGYGYLVMLLMVTAISAALGFYQISEAIERILSENYKSVAAAVGMLESLERQNTEVLAILLEDKQGIDTLEGAEESFNYWYSEAKANTTAQGEAGVLTSINQSYHRYILARNALIDEHGDNVMDAYTTLVFPAYAASRTHVFELMSINHQAIISADEDARRTALQVAGWLGFLVTVALVSIAFLARAMQQQILIKFFELTDAAEQIWAGEHTRRFNLVGNDELGILARQLNGALDKQEELQGEMRGRLNQQKQLVLGLMEFVPGNGLLIGLDGQVIASTIERDLEGQIPIVTTWIKEHRQEVLKSYRDERECKKYPIVIDSDHVADVQLLASDSKRVVGWYIQFVSPENSSGES